MKKLSEITEGIKILKTTGPLDVKISAVEFDSRQVAPDCIFVAVKGSQVDGHIFIDKAIEMGATVIVCNTLPKNLKTKITYLQVEDTSIVLGKMASNFFDNPSGRLILVGVTGTNGKTTIANLLYGLFRKLGYKAGVLSTIENKIEEQVIGATHTTPDPVQMNNLMGRMVESGCTHCFIESSSHAIHQNRIAGLHFDGGIFTNITHDHLDYHKTFDEYIKAKKKFFDELPSDAFALTNVDDRNGLVMIQNTKALKKTYSLKSISDFKARIIENQFEGLQLSIDGKELWCKLVGEFNAYNLLAVYGAAVLLGEDPDRVLTTLSALEVVEGRFDYFISPNKIVGIVDYAHTPDALENVLKTINAIRTRNEKLITIVGAGGDRDPQKRKLMGGIAGRMSDKVIITSDNPRSEDPDAIIDQIYHGLDPEHKARAICITRRRDAIKTASLLAEPGDIILLAGKGHENYQEIKGVKYPFNDKVILQEFLMIKPTNN
ncbi:MAG: UDP-N-acetylmuramoyl-L-alanyl-D-glutamate--2,6-diaminopimelate ligase [Bacteroidales bacterium]|nr:UDP-N-acetylmuramoyl-L-alanyl-D-glutamate--2,6-diaminopimelate ligase [Bacteroidales bacterium]